MFNGLLARKCIKFMDLYEQPIELNSMENNNGVTYLDSKEVQICKPITVVSFSFTQTLYQYTIRKLFLIILFFVVIIFLQ